MRSYSRRRDICQACQSRRHHRLRIAPDGLQDAGCPVFEHYLDQLAEADIAQSLYDSDKSGALQNEGDPRVILATLEATKRLAKDKVADYIESCPIVPSLDVQCRLAIVAFLSQTLQQEIHVRHNQRLLLAHRAVLEAVRQRAAEALVLFAVSVDDRRAFRE